MAKQLQPTQHTETTYNRPNVPWECGHMCEGKSCALGPTAKGQCRAEGECRPIRKGDRWECTRTEVFGGPCDQGPHADGSCCRQLTPCAPRRSVRNQRRVAVWITCAATVGLMAFLLTTGQLWDAQKAIDPGPLAKVHGGGGMECSDCHQGSLASGAENAELASLDMTVGSQKCLECHQNAIGSWETARFAHGVPPELLQHKEHEEVDENPPLFVQLAAWTPVKHAGAEGELQCAVCHQEHHGREFDLTALSDQQCQVCHTDQFSSFQHGHPDITSFQSGRRSQIYFDHGTHLQKHFSAKKEEWSEMQGGQESCRVCHTPDEKGQDMLAPTFESACSSCHSGSTRKGELEVLALPALSPKAVDGWPMVISNPPSLSPLAKWLIAGQDEASETIEKFESIDDPRRVKEDAEIATTLAVKTALVEALQTLQTEGPASYYNPQSPPAGLSAETASSVNSFLATVPPAVFEELLAEIHDSQPKPEEKAEEEEKPASTPAEPTKTIPPGGNLLGTPPAADDKPDQPANLLGSPPAGSGNLLQTPDSNDEKPEPGGGNLLQMPKSEDKKPAGGGNLLQTPKPSAEGNLLGTPPPASEDKPAQSGNLLGTPPPSSGGGNNLLGTPPSAPEGGNLLNMPPPGDTPVPAEPEPEEEKGLSPEIEKDALRQWASNTSWSYSKLRIAYRPSGHADSFLRIWLDTAAETLSSGESSELVKDAALDILNSTEAGSCLMCHTVDKSEDGTITINWQSQIDEKTGPVLTAFKHDKHINSLKVAGLADAEAMPGFAQSCITCHVMVPSEGENSYASQFAWDRGLKAPVPTDPHHAKSNFAAFSLRQACATCHTEEKAGASCLTCHQYHSQPPVSATSNTSNLTTLDQIGQEMAVSQ